MKLKKIFLLFALAVFISNLIGCDAFVRKFSRKPKNGEQAVEMVLAPEEYKVKMSKEELYRQYFVFWQSWQEELISSLTYNDSHKRQIDCAKEALKNLMSMRALLGEDKQKKLDLYIDKLKELQGDLQDDLYSSRSFRIAQKAEKLKMEIMRDFSFPKIKNYML